MKRNTLLKRWIVPALFGTLTTAFTLAFLCADRLTADWMPPLHANDGYGYGAFDATLAQSNGGGTPIISEYELDDEIERNISPSNIQVFTDSAKILGRCMADAHLLHKIFDPHMAPTAWTNYLTSLDYQRMFLLQSDIDEFSKTVPQIPSLLAKGDLDFPRIVFERLHERVRDRVAFVERTVTNTFEFTSNETFHWKRDDRPWPASQAEQDELWSKSIANAFLISMVSTTLANERNEERKASLRLDIARHLYDSTSTNAIPEDELTSELHIFDTVIDHPPTNAFERAALCLALLPTWQRPDPAPTNATNETVAEIPTSTVESGNAQLETLVAEYATAANGIKTLEQARTDAAEKVLKSYRQYLSILNDSDAESHLSKFLNAITTAYDPHSNYLSPIAQEDFGIDMQLSLQGIGAQLQSEDGAAKIVEIIPGSPAEHDRSETRLVPGDKIIGVAQDDDEFIDIRHWPLYKAVRLIRGPKNSTVRLQVIPANDANSTKIVTLIRDEIKLEEQAASSRIETTIDENGLERKLGYIKLPTFYSSMRLGSNPDATPRSATLDVARLIADLNTEDVEGLVLDLRGNGGGSLPEAVYLTGLFIQTGPVVQVKESRRTVTLPDNDPAVAFTKPLVVMIDRISASASEIVAGALQDYGRAVIVGDSHTHGKGTVQTLLPLHNGDLGSLKATTASFYRITGSSTQIRGVSSDIHLPSIFECYAQLGEDKLPNAIPWSRTGPARYRKIDNLEETISQLAERSMKRREGNDRWKRHTQRLDHFATITTNQLVSLNFDERLAQVKGDEKIQREITEQDHSDTPAIEFGDNIASPPTSETTEPETKEQREVRKRKHDIVLDETLDILVDLIDLHGRPRNLIQDQHPYNFLDSFFQ